MNHFAIYASCFSCCLVCSPLAATYWERADTLALVCDVLLYFCHFPIWYPGSGVVLDCNDSRSVPPVSSP